MGSFGLVSQDPEVCYISRVALIISKWFWPWYAKTIQPLVDEASCVCEYEWIKTLGIQFCRFRWPKGITGTKEQMQIYYGLEDRKTINMMTWYPRNTLAMSTVLEKKDYLLNSPPPCHTNNIVSASTESPQGLLFVVVGWLKIGSHYVFLAGLECTMYKRLVLNSRSSFCLCLQEMGLMEIHWDILKLQ